LFIASLALTIALVLLSLGFLLNVYFIERWILSRDFDLGESVAVTKAAGYSVGFGNLAEIVGLIFIVQAVMTYQSRANLLALILQARLNLVKWMLILSAILFAVYLFVWFGVSDLSVNFSSS